MENLISSVIGTLCAEIITLPICTVKTVYQNNPNLGITQTISKIYKESGYRGFVQAYTPAIISQVVSTSSKYYFYQLIKSHRKTEKSDILNNSLNGMVGGILGSFFSHPVDVWKNYLQRNQKFPFGNPSVYYQGYSASIYKTSVLYASLFPLHDYYTNKFDIPIIPSICTTLTVSIIIQPFDYYKTIKMAGNKPENWYKITNWYRGFSLMLARSIPHFVITMGITDLVKEHIKN